MPPLLEDARPLLGGYRLDGASLGTREHISPHDGRAQALVHVCGAAEIDRAAQAATQGQRAWLAMGGTGRRDCLIKLAELVAAEEAHFRDIAALECGTPVAIGGGAPLAISWIRYYAGWADKIDGSAAEPIGANGLTYVRHEPYGVVGVIIPWNSPLVAISMTAILALAAGNAVILKPPTQTPFAALRFGDLALQAGIPPGALNVVPGDAEAGEALIAHPAIGKISFTGGATVARAVMRTAADHLKPVALELGGKSANIVFDDADLDAAAQMATMLGLVVLSGQGCVLPTRVYVQDPVFDGFVERVHGIAGSLRMGDPRASTTMVGPVISEAAAQRILGVIDRAKAEAGGVLVTGGGRGTGELAAGAYVEPTIFAGIDHDSHLAREEVFGPVLSILRFSTEEEVVAKSNDSRFGLGAYLHTNDLRRAHRMAASLEAGAIAINGGLPMGPNMPFGGYKQSGFGREGGRAGLEEFMQLKQVLVHL